MKIRLQTAEFMTSNKLEGDNIMNKTFLLLAVTMITMLITVQAYPAEEINTENPIREAMAELLIAETPAQAADIVQAMMIYAVERGGTTEELMQRIAMLSAAAIGASPDFGEAVAEAIILGVGPSHSSVAVAAIAIAAQDNKSIVMSAINVLPEDQKELGELAAENPEAVLGAELVQIVAQTAREFADIAATMHKSQKPWSAVTTTTTTTTPTTTTSWLITYEINAGIDTIDLAAPTPTPVGKR